MHLHELRLQHDQTLASHSHSHSNSVASQWQSQSQSQPQCRSHSHSVAVIVTVRVSRAVTVAGTVTVIVALTVTSQCQSQSQSQSQSLQVSSPAASHPLTRHLNEKQQRRRADHEGAENTCTTNVRFRLFTNHKPFQLAPVASAEAYLSLLHPLSRSPP